MTDVHLNADSPSAPSKPGLGAPRPINRSVAYWATTIAVGTHALLAVILVMAFLPLEPIVRFWVIHFTNVMNAQLPAVTVMAIDLHFQCQQYWYIVPLLLLVVCAIDAWVFHFLFRRRSLRFLAMAWFFLGFLFLLLFVIVIKAGLEMPYLDWLEYLR